MGGALFRNQWEQMQKPTAEHKAEPGEPAKVGGIVEASGVEGTRRTLTTGSTQQHS